MPQPGKKSRAGFRADLILRRGGFENERVLTSTGWRLTNVARWTSKSNVLAVLSVDGV
jgi:hypothetical protein